MSRLGAGAPLREAAFSSPSPSGEGLGVGLCRVPSGGFAGLPHPNPSPEGEGLRG